MDCEERLSSFYDSEDAIVYNSGYDANVGFISSVAQRGDYILYDEHIHASIRDGIRLSYAKAYSFRHNDLDDLESIEHDCVEQKLNEAIQLKRARDLGVDRDCLKLSNYKSKGDNYVVKELLKSALMKTSLDPSISDLIIDGVRQFANDVGVDFDKALHQYSIELGDSRKDNIPHYLQDATRLAQWCKSPSVMCLIVLSMLQKALVSIQRPPNLSQIADSAIQSATDDYIKSELKEAARLLSIDYLVRKYCGNGAQEYFRVVRSMLPYCFFFFCRCCSTNNLHMLVFLSLKVQPHSWCSSGSTCMPAHR